MGKKIISTNRKAFHEYHIFDKFNAGMVLTGTEIKSIRKGAINLKDSFVKIDDAEVFLYNCHISPYEQGNRYNHEEKRTRKLLLNKHEILKFEKKIKEKGLTIVPTKMYFNEDKVKVEIALAKGKHLYDKKKDLMKSDLKRYAERQIKNY